MSTPIENLKPVFEKYGVNPQVRESIVKNMAAQHRLIVVAASIAAAKIDPGIKGELQGDLTMEELVTKFRSIENLGAIFTEILEAIMADQKAIMKLTVTNTQRKAGTGGLLPGDLN